MPKKEVLTQFHKDSIAAAADKLIRERGIAHTKMDDIAQEAQYSKATIYTYFKSKDEIFYHNVLKGMRLLHEAFAQILGEEKDFATLYLAACNRLSRFCDEQPLYFHSMLETIDASAESRAKTPLLAQIYETGEQLNGDIACLLQKGIAQGVVRADLPAAPTGMVLWASLSGTIALANNKEAYILQRMGMDKEKFLQFSFALLYQTIVKGAGK